MKTAQQWWEVWLAMPTNTGWEDLVEAIREEQRKAQLSRRRPPVQEEERS